MSDHPEQFQYDEATVSPNGASSLPGILPVDDNAPAAVVAQSAPVADSSAPGAASVSLIDELTNGEWSYERSVIVGLLDELSLTELRKVSHYIYRLKDERKQEVLFA